MHAVVKQCCILYYSLSSYSYNRKREQTIEILLYLDGDLLVSGFVVLTSGTSVPTFTFIHFTSPTSFYGFSELSDCRPLLTQSLSCWFFNEKDFSQRHVRTFKSPPHTRPHISFYFFWIISSLRLSNFPIRYNFLKK